MASLDVSGLTDDQRPTGLWAASLVHAIARDEVAGRRTRRLTERKLDTWTRFRGRLTSVDLVTLLLEDAAVVYSVPFNPAAISGELHPERLPEALTDTWLESVGSLTLSAPGHEYITEQARLLGLSTRLARSDLQIVKPHQKVLELPGTGGQLTHHIATTQRGLSLQDNFVVACGTWQELTLAGIIALEFGAPHSEFATRVEEEDLKNPEHPVRQRTFDFVVGLQPEKGGLFRLENQLALWFPAAKVVLV